MVFHRIKTNSSIFDICQRYESRTGSVKCKLLLYADDSALLDSRSDVSEIEDVLIRVDWLVENRCHCTLVKLNQYYLGPTSGLLRGESYTSHVIVMTLSQGQRSLILVLL